MLENAQFQRVNSVTDEHLEELFGKNKLWGALKQLILKNKDTQTAFQNMAADIFDNQNIRYEISGLENIPKDGAFFIAPNHPSIKEDHKILFNGTYSLPYHMFFLDKILHDQEISNSFITSAGKGALYSTVLKLLGFYGLKKNKDGTISKKEKERLNNWISDRIKSNTKSRVGITIFPEGHQNGIGNFGKLKKGLLWSAKENQIPVVPARMDGFDENGKEYQDVKIHFDKPFMVEKDQNLTSEYVERIRKEVYQDRLGLTLVEGR